MEKKRAGGECERNENTIGIGRNRVFSLPLSRFFLTYVSKFRRTHVHARIHTRTHLPIPRRWVRNGWPDFRVVRRWTNVAMARLKLRVCSSPPSRRGIKLYGVSKKMLRVTGNAVDVSTRNSWRAARYVLQFISGMPLSISWNRRLLYASAIRMIIAVASNLTRFISCSECDTLAWCNWISARAQLYRCSSLCAKTDVKMICIRSFLTIGNR